MIVYVVDRESNHYSKIFPQLRTSMVIWRLILDVQRIIKVFATLQRLKMKYILSFLFVCFIQQASGMANMDAFLNDLINDQDTGIFYRL